MTIGICMNKGNRSTGSFEQQEMPNLCQTFKHIPASPISAIFLTQSLVLPVCKLNNIVVLLFIAHTSLHYLPLLFFISYIFIGWLPFQKGELTL